MCFSIDLDERKGSPMTLEVTCSCGQRLLAREELAGKQVRCPKCGATLLVPQQAPRNAMLELLDEEGVYGSPQCPNCIPPHAVVCIECGYDKRLGRKRVTKR